VSRLAHILTWHLGGRWHDQCESVVWVDVCQGWHIFSRGTWVVLGMTSVRVLCEWTASSATLITLWTHAAEYDLVKWNLWKKETTRGGEIQDIMPLGRCTQVTTLVGHRWWSSCMCCCICTVEWTNSCRKVCCDKLWGAVLYFLAVWYRLFGIMGGPCHDVCVGVGDWHIHSSDHPCLSSWVVLVVICMYVCVCVCRCGRLAHTLKWPPSLVILALSMLLRCWTRRLVQRSSVLLTTVHWGYTSHHCVRCLHAVCCIYCQS